MIGLDILFLGFNQVHKGALSLDTTEMEDQPEQDQSPWACTRLKRLFVGDMIWSDHDHRNKWGQRQLESLQELQFLTLKGMCKQNQQWEMGDFGRSDLGQNPKVQWMIKTWSHLQRCLIAEPEVKSIVSSQVWRGRHAR